MIIRLVGGPADGREIEVSDEFNPRYCWREEDLSDYTLATLPDVPMFVNLPCGIDYWYEYMGKCRDGMPKYVLVSQSF